MKYDVIVIGAGPAGTTFARITAEKGMNVLVLDKRKELGEPVRCAEGLGRREVDIQGLILPKEVISTDIKGSRIVSPSGHELIWEDEEATGWVLERKMFDRWLAELAVEKGARIRTYTRVLDLIKENGKIKGVIASHQGEESYEIEADLVVSAEGMESIIARKAGFKTFSALSEVDTCYQYEMQPYNHRNLIELYLGNEIAKRGYVWVFPKGKNKANVGIGIGGHLTNAVKGGSLKGADPKILLDKFIKQSPELKDSSTLQDFGGVISVGAPIDEFVADNFMVIGTAARQVDPIHGGGIARSMEAARIAAGVAAEAKKKNDYSKKTLSEYEKIWRKGPGKILEKRLLFRKVLEKFSDADLDYIIKNITQEDLKDVMAGNFFRPVMKLLKGNPGLLKVLGALIS
ncbi:NAD(P)/FAD-dependent oxidoreductase [Candidatus Micrarchaeota archaeon]|nr:NAD(P)/FAD-dependent oxidoreductase [Candidatus Micrarchaeota archaeon]